MAVGSIRWPRRYGADGLVIEVPLANGAEMLGGHPRRDLVHGLLGARLDHEAGGFRGVVGDPEEEEVGRTDLALFGDGSGDPVDEPGPIPAPEQDHRKML